MNNMKAFVRLNQQTMTVVQRDVVVPTMGEEEVSVKMEAAGVGIHDRYFIPSNASFPYVIGTEGAGRIVATGSGVTEFVKGDRVIVSTSLNEKGGCWSEYAMVAPDKIVSLPATLSYLEGAALPIAGKTALECLESVGLKMGETLFVAGGSGAVGSFLIQFAKVKGLKVAASASRENQAYLKQLGADYTVDYQDPNWKQKIEEYRPGGVDAAVSIPQGVEEQSAAVVKKGGALVVLSGKPNLLKQHLKIKQLGHRLDWQKSMTTILKWVIAGQVKVHLAEAVPFEKALMALEKTEMGHARGKTVITFSETIQKKEEALFV